LRTLTTLHCNIPGDLDACNLSIIGISHSRTERSVSTGGKIPASLRTAPHKHAGGRTSLPVRRIVDATATRTSRDHLYFLVGFFPSPGTSYFLTVLVDSSDSLSVEQKEPTRIDTQDPNCSVVLPQGAVAYYGTSAGSLIRWNIRYSHCF